MIPQPLAIRQLLCEDEWLGAPSKTKGDSGGIDADLVEDWNAQRQAISSH